ncbi:YihY/virulence factor BrkB family protein [Verrucomicrobiaceae bacterium 227]
MSLPAFRRIGKVPGVFMKAGAGFMEHQALRLSAALSFYSVFSIGPLLIIVIALSGFVFGDEAVRGQLQTQLEAFMGERSASVVEDIVESSARPMDSVVMGVVGLFTLFFGATGVFGQLKDALNSIWEVDLSIEKAVTKFVKDRLFSFSMVLGIGFLMLVSMVLTTGLEALSGFVEKIFPLVPVVWQALNFLGSFAMVTVLFAMIFKVLPDVRIRWSDVWVGSAVTALLFGLGKFAIGIYLAREATASPYGAAGAFVLVLLWVYFSSVILLFGAEFTRVWAEANGHRMIPVRGAKLSGAERS